MKIQGTEIQSTVKNIDFDLKGIYKEPVLSFTLDGIDLLKVAIDVNTIASASGANDTIVFKVSLGDDAGSLTKQIHIPTFKAENTPEETVEAEPEAKPEVGVEPIAAL